jgi:hypothetical protein
MRRDRWKGGLVWLGVTAVVSGVVAAGDWVGPESGSLAPGHDPSTCGACRAHEPTKGPPLPYELDNDNVRFTYPAAKAAHDARG